MKFKTFVCIITDHTNKHELGLVKLGYFSFKIGYITGNNHKKFVKSESLELILFR